MRLCYPLQLGIAVSVKPLESLGYWRGQEPPMNQRCSVCGIRFLASQRRSAITFDGQAFDKLRVVNLFGSGGGGVLDSVSADVSCWKAKPVNISILSCSFLWVPSMDCPDASVSGFETFCVEELKGAITGRFHSCRWFIKMVCKIGGIPDSYVQGRLSTSLR